MICTDSHRLFERRARSRHTPVIMALALALAGTPVGAQDSPSAASPGLQRADPGSLITILVGTTGTPAAREAAADRLVQLAHRPEVARSVSTLFEEGAAPPDVQGIVLAAIARTWDVPSRLARPLLEAAERADPQHAPGFMPPIAALRSPEAARALVQFLDDVRPMAVRTAAAEALARMTGRDDLADDSRAWREWLEQARGLSGQEWSGLLAQGVWRRAQRLEADRRVMAERLTDGYRRLYLALPAEPADDRDRLLTQMLSGSRPELRDLGFEIVSREIAGGKIVDGAVSEVALSLLASADPAIRAKAAALVVQLPHGDAGHRLAQSLVSETDPVAASQMLLGLARWPDAIGRDPALRWLEAGQDAAPAAADALLALFREGLLPSPGDQARAVSALRQIPPVRLTPSCCHLLVTFGQEQDLVTVASLLGGSSSPLKQAAAGALAGKPAFLDQILAAARSDPSLFNSAVTAVCVGRPDAQGFAAIESLAATTAVERDDGLLRVAAVLSSVDMIAAARSTRDPALRAAMLSRLTEHSAPLPGSLGADPPGTIGAGLMLLAATYLEMKRPDLAANALEALPATGEGSDHAEVTRLRAVALLWTNRMDEAMALNAPPSAWLDGLERAIAEPHAAAILKAIRDQFADRLTEPDADRLRQLAARLAAARTSADGEPLDTAGPG